DSHARLYVNFGPNPDKPASEATVSARTSALLRRDPQTPIIVKADTTVPYGTVVRAMVLLQHAGATKVGFLTDPVRPAARGQPGRAGGGSGGMLEFLREHWWAVVLSVVLLGLLVGGLVVAALISVYRKPPSVQPLPIDA